MPFALKAVGAVAGIMLIAPIAGAAENPVPRSAADIIAASKPADWRALDPQHTLYLELASGRVVIELAPAFAPAHVANIEALAREHYFDGLAIVRVQDNYVVQWGDPAGDDAQRKPFKNAKKELQPEYSVPYSDALPFARLADGDLYAPQVGFSYSLPAARDPKTQQTWLTHCYGMVGVGRGDNPDNGNGSELYVVIGNAPRHLDRNVIVVGRVMQGIERLSSLPRGTGNLGFYEKPEQYVPIRSVRLASDVPPAERSELEVLRSDTPTFAAFVDARRNRREAWFQDPVGHIELCNVPVVVRAPAAGR
ncbi:MAG TPA: peptidylprolyl isomerase [Nevskiaceae bacterium]|nr:peptidylprolyl isomerase [Nevskiaceae bacterium]